MLILRGEVDKQICIIALLMADILYRLCRGRGVKVLRYDYFRIDILRVAVINVILVIIGHYILLSNK